MDSEIEGFILFGDLNTVVFWYCNKTLEQYLRNKCTLRGIDPEDLTGSMTQLFGHLINVEAQYDTKQNNVELIFCENGFTIKLRHLGIYSLLVIGNSEEDSHLLYMADMFRAVAQLFVGYSYGSLVSKSESCNCIADILRRNSLLTNGVPYQFLRACEVVPRESIESTSTIVSSCLDKLVSSTSAAAILDGFGTVLEAHCFASNMLIGSVRCTAQGSKQRVLPSELWKLRDMANVVARPSADPEACTTVNIFLNACESPYFLACRAHVISPSPDVACILLTEHNWSSIARPIRRLLKLLSMILRGQPSVLRLTPRHLDTIASTELNRMSDCLDEFWSQETSRSGVKTPERSGSYSDTSSLTGSVSTITVFPSGVQMLPPLSPIRLLMQRALNQFRTLRSRNVFQSFCRDPRNPAHHASVKQLYNIVEQLHTLLFQPLVFVSSPDIFARPLFNVAQELTSTFSDARSFGPSLPPLNGDCPIGSNLMMCVLVDRSSNTFACYPSLRLDFISYLSFRNNEIAFVMQDLLNSIQTLMWRCWSLIRSGHAAASWATDFVDSDAFGLRRITPVRFAYACNVATAKSTSEQQTKQSTSGGTLPVGDSAQFDPVFNDPDVTSQLIWNEHFYRLLARIYSDSMSLDLPDGRKQSTNVFSLDFNAAMRSRPLDMPPEKPGRVTSVYEAFCLFLEPVAPSDVEKVFRSMFSDGIEALATENDHSFPFDDAVENL